LKKVAGLAPLVPLASTVSDDIRMMFATIRLVSDREFAGVGSDPYVELREGMGAFGTVCRGNGVDVSRECRAREDQ
jgi:hypothetical protein